MFKIHQVKVTSLQFLTQCSCLPCSRISKFPAVVFAVKRCLQSFTGSCQITPFLLIAGQKIMENFLTLSCIYYCIWCFRYKLILYCWNSHLLTNGQLAVTKEPFLEMLPFWCKIRTPRLIFDIYLINDFLHLTIIKAVSALRSNHKLP